MVKSKDLCLKLGESLTLRTPDGKVKDLVISELRNSSGENIESASMNSIAFINHISGISVKTRVYRQ